MNDREFVQKELLKRIDDLERELKDVRENYRQQFDDLNRKKEEMRSEYER